MVETINLDDQLSEITDKLGEILSLDSSISNEDVQNNAVDEDEDEEIDDNNDDEEEESDGEFEFEFSFAGGDLSSPVSAEEVFHDGKIRPIFPFTTDVNGGEEAGTSYGPQVKKVFVVEEDDVAEGPYCVWSSEKSTAEEPAPEMSKKSNSTGFSKLWRVKDLLVRSNSDGRDAFVFMPGKETAAVPVVVKKERKVSLRKLKIGGGGGDSAVAASGERKKEKKKGKKLSAATPVAKAPGTTAYEALYGKKEKKKSYLPYRQDLVGFFTNANGMTRNVHPY